jgi:hypothetical protein
MIAMKHQTHRVAGSGGYRMAAVGLVLLVGAVSEAGEIVDDWRYVLQRPSGNWTDPAFDDADWSAGKGGFGTRGTPGARIGTIWRTNAIWLRKAFSLDALPENPALLVHYDQDAEVYLNGERIMELPGYVGDYKVRLLDDAGRAALKVGENVLAVFCRNRGGGQFIDAHIVDANNVPELPAPAPVTKPFDTALITTWGAQVTPENAWTEYPRPALRREKWQNLNGRWDHAITADTVQAAPPKWDGKILVPFCLESKLGGVQRLLLPNEALWYRRTFKVPDADDQRTLLNFEAVDYRCAVFVNGKQVATHRGGSTPFSVDVTPALKPGANELIVRVEDDTGGWQLRGKQVREPNAIWYTRVSGIWQTVWLEQVPNTYIEELKISTDAANGVVTVKTIVGGGNHSGQYEVVIKDNGRTVANVVHAQATFELPIPDAKLWSPESPHLYDVEVALLTDTGRTIDAVSSYAGLRDVGKVRDADGHWRFTLNGEPIFHWGTLDQGWWPDGLLTPPSDAALRYDIEYLKAAGFNMTRKHIKVEPRRFYYHCDQLGLLVWQDQVSGGQGAPWTQLRPDPRDATWPKEAHEQYMLELERMIDTLENHPCIVVWVPFNEAWTQHMTIPVGKWTVQRDPSRSVNIASGGNFWPVGDIVDSHNYPHPAFPFNLGRGGRFDDYIKVIGEFGGHGYPVKGHLWNANRNNWGYGGLPQNKDEYKKRYIKSLKMLNELRQQGIAAGVYTQTTDVEGEINGLLTYDRKVTKIPADELAALHKILFKPAGHAATDEH